MTTTSLSNNPTNDQPGPADTRQEERAALIHGAIEGLASLELPDEQFWADPRWEKLADKLEAIFSRKTSAKTEDGVPPSIEK